MDIEAFGIGPASKFATEKCKTPTGSTLAGATVADESRYREWAAIRSGSAGLDFQKDSLRFRFPVVSFIPCKAADSRI
jgi:hypothetical protein